MHFARGFSATELAVKNEHKFFHLRQRQRCFSCSEPHWQWPSHVPWPERNDELLLQIFGQIKYAIKKIIKSLIVAQNDGTSHLPEPTPIRTQRKCVNKGAFASQAISHFAIWASLVILLKSSSNFCSKLALKLCCRATIRARPPMWIADGTRCLAVQSASLFACR